MFCASVFILWYLYASTLGKPIPYTQKPKNPLLAHVPGLGKFRGTQVLTTENDSSNLMTPVDAWLGLEYAKQPVGDLRFAPPEWPHAVNGTVDADQFGPACIQDPSRNGSPQSEACLNFNVWRTTGVPLATKLPVLVFFHGGSFVSGDGKGFDGGNFVSKSVKPIMVVTMQYRLGALGSLPSALFEEEGLLNLGLLDQRLFLEFLQKYISHFGGNPKAITLAGLSAGGHSVGIHLFHDYGSDKGKPLFAQAIMSSSSPTARSFPEATADLYVRQFQEFMDYVDCPTTPNSDALDCLRSVDISLIQAKSASMYRDSEFNITWPWQPVSPGPLLEKRGSESGFDRTFFKIPILVSSSTDEGKLFAPQNLSSTQNFTSFMANMNPGFNSDDLADLESLYPDPEDPSSPYYDSPLSVEFNRVSAAYGDYAYICPVEETAALYAALDLPVYKARFNTPNGAASYMGVSHASDNGYFQGLPNVQFPEISDLYSAYWASFVVSGSPNTYRVEGAPEWNRYKGVGGKELKVGSEDGTGTGVELEGDDDGIRVPQCKWWRDPDRMERLKK
ncbi:alpha/beta-hydrolase [Lophiostoma macrostomum CBS 122681]|uniref:Carboxylic ester hydrolase n=1 Tax=Lophiostoma macrostomum CBS 122681 TaxID=1314788 RepID=A0A6A6SP23_9PLEO|nr:alpha/beta-hydrolase [Lophiostoma macrostomum CBS 122681]